MIPLLIPMIMQGSGLPPSGPKRTGEDPYFPSNRTVAVYGLVWIVLSVIAEVRICFVSFTYYDGRMLAFILCPVVLSIATVMAMLLYYFVKFIVRTLLGLDDV